MRKKVWHCRGERKNREAGCSLGNFCLLGTLVYHSKNLFKDWYLKMLLDQRQKTVSRECSTVLFLCNQNFWLSLCNLWRRVNTRWTACHWLLASNLLCMIELLHKMLSPQFQLVPLALFSSSSCPANTFCMMYLHQFYVSCEPHSVVYATIGSGGLILLRELQCFYCCVALERVNQFLSALLTYGVIS